MTRGTLRDRRMAASSYRRPARVGFETVKSRIFAPLARAASRASVSRLRVSFQFVRSENISEREQVHLEAGVSLNPPVHELVHQARARRPAADVVLHAAPFPAGPVANRNCRTEQVLSVLTQQLPQGLHPVEQALAGIRRHHQMRLVSKQQVALLADGSIRL